MKTLLRRLQVLLFLTLPVVATAQTLTTIYSFTALHSSTNGDGAYPRSGLLVSGDALYGTTLGGGSVSEGTIFGMSADGTSFTNIHNFLGDSYGDHLNGGLVLSGNTLYGTAGMGSFGGNAPGGIVFAINTDGTGFTNLHTFTGGSDGSDPQTGLVLSGNTLYGTTYGGGSSGQGTVFAINTDGTGFTVLHTFPGYGYDDGGFPNSTLLLAGDTLYGTTEWAGASGQGTVFAINTNGTSFTVLHGFPAMTGVNSTNSDGAQPVGCFVVTGNTVYGTAKKGGSAGSGTVFAVNTDGSGFANLHSFTAGTGSWPPTNSDGVMPNGLVLIGDTLYGVAAYGGSSGNGTVFHINTNGTGFTTLYNLRDRPISGLALSGSKVFGTAGGGGSPVDGTANGTVYRLNLDTAPATDFTYTTNAGAITITGYTGAGGNVIIPDTITGLPVASIGEGAFYGSYSLTNITIPDSITSIGELAFAVIDNLAAVRIGNGVTNIGPGAFYGCFNLASIDLGDSVIIVQREAFAMCSSLTNVILPNSVVSIGDHIFEGCSSLASFVIPNNITSVEEAAFWGCVGLKSVTIGSGVTNIGLGFFGDCTSLTNISFGTNVTIIDAYAFYGCASLTSVTIPNSVTDIGSFAFRDCTSLTSAYFLGNAPLVNGGPGSADTSVFANTTVTGVAYYNSGTTGWDSTFGGWPTVLTNYGCPTITLTSASTNETAPAGMVAWWPGNGDATDIAGTNNGTLVGGASFAAGEVGQGFALNGSGYVSVPHNPAWDFGANDFSIELWAKFNAPGGALIADDNGGGGNNKWVLFHGYTGNTLCLHLQGSASANIGNFPFSPTAGQWYHIAVTRTGSAWTFYVNGVAIGTEILSVVVPATSAPLTIGMAEGGFFFNGLLDEVSIYNRGITSDEVAAIYNAGSTGKHGGNIGVFYSQTNTASGGTAPYSYAVTAGSLPPGLVFATNGILSGTPSQNGAFNYTVTATDANGCIGSSNYTVSVMWSTNTNHPAYQVVDLGVLPGGLDDSYATAVNAAGQVIGRSGGDYPAGIDQGFIWDAVNGIRNLGVLYGISTEPNGINNQGVVVGNSGPGHWFVAVKWDSVNGIQDLGIGAIAGYPYYTARSINDAGVMAYNNWNFYGPPSKAYLLSGGTATWIGELYSGAYTWPNGLNNNNEVAGSSSSAQIMQAFYWNAGQGMVGLGFLPDYSHSSASGINDSSQVVGGCTKPDGTSAAFIWTAGAGMSQLDSSVIGGSNSWANFINASGVAVGHSQVAGTNHAVMWASGQSAVDLNSLVQNLNLNGWDYIKEARGINASGMIVGEGIRTNGVRHACIIYPIAGVPPTITLSPATLTNGTLGFSYNQSVTASGGTAPYSYAVTSGLLISGLSLTTNGLLTGIPFALGTNTFTVTATDANGCTGSQTYTLAVNGSGPADIAVPTLKIVAPANNKILTNAVTPVIGTAKDNKGGGGVVLVLYSFNGGDLQLATTTNRFTNWTANVTFNPGPNKIVAYALDYRGNASKPVTNAYFFSVPQPFTLLTVGDGTVTATKSTYGTPTNGATLIVKRPYTVAAVSGSNYIFSNWLASVDGGPAVVATNTAKYTFLMQTNLTLTAQFAPNRFLTATGSYNGLFWDTNNGVAYQSAGFASVKVTAKQGKLATFSASLSFAGEKRSSSGTFNLTGNGVGKKPFYLKVATNTFYQLYLHLPPDGPLTGVLSNLNGSWSAVLSADKQDEITNYAGQYTMVLPGSLNPAEAPQGDGYGLVTVDTNGIVKLAGALGDGTAISQKVPVSENGDWPLFASVYKTTNNNVKVKGGVLLGWLSLTNGLDGTLYHIKTAVPGPMYPSGFTNEFAPLSSTYTNSALTTNRIIELTSGSNGVVTLSGGGLPESLTNLISLSVLNKFAAPVTNTAGVTNKLTLTLAPKTGKLTGTFKTNGVTATALTGVVLQNATNGHGYFLGATNSGSLLLQGR